MAIKPSVSQSGPALGTSGGRVDPNTGEHFFAGGNFEEESAQMKPLNDLLTSGQYRNVNGNTISDYLTGKISLETAVNQVKGTPLYDPSKGRQVNFGQGNIDIGYAPDSMAAADIGKGPMGGGSGPRDASGATPVVAETPYFLWTGSEQDQSSGASGSGNEGPSIPGGYKSPEDVQSSIEAVSTDTKGAGVDTRGKTLSSIISDSLNQGGTPESIAKGGGNAPSGLPNPDLGPAPTFDAYQEEMMLRGKYGVDSMQSALEGIDKQIADITARTNEEYQKVNAEPVSSAVRAKKLAIVKASDSAEKSALVSQRQLLTKQISDANQGISMLMSSMKSDYAAAKSEWTKQYNANLSYIKSFDAGTTPLQKHEKAALTLMLNSMAGGKMTPDKLTQDQKNTLNQLITAVYGPEFQGIQDELPDRTTAYSKSFTGADGKRYVQNLYVNKDGSIDMSYTTPVKSTTTQYGTFTKADYGQLQNAYGLSADYINGLIDSYNSGTDLQTLREQLTNDNVDPVALDWIMHYYDPINNAKPKTAGGGTTTDPLVNALINNLSGK